MFIPGIHKSVHAKSTKLTSQVRHAVSADVTVHVKKLLVSQMDQSLLQWVIDPVVYFRPHMLNSSKQQTTTNWIMCVSEP